jgi:hypothetical protein
MSISHPFCDGVGLLKAGFPSFRKIQLFIPYLVTYMRTAVMKWAKQCPAWGSTLHTVEAIKKFIDLIEKHGRRQLLAGEHP